MIKLEVQPYCEKCRSFEADVEQPKVDIMQGFDHGQRVPIEHIVQSDTVVRCVNRRKCENIKRFLEQRVKEEKK